MDELNNIKYHNLRKAYSSLTHASLLRVTRGKEIAATSLYSLTSSEDRGSLQEYTNTSIPSASSFCKPFRLRILIF